MAVPGEEQDFAVGSRIKGTEAAVVLRYLFTGGTGGAAVCLYATWVL